MRYYATEEEIAENPLLEDASLLIDQSVTSIYETDPEGFPTDERLRDALGVAAKAQAAAMAEQASSRIRSEAQDGLAITYENRKDSVDYREYLAPKTWNILAQAGLMNNQVWSY